MDMEEEAHDGVLELLEQPDGCFNLAEIDLGLRTAIKIIAEAAGKRVAAGEDADTALRVAIDMFELYLESADPKAAQPFDLARWMASTTVPAFETRDGQVIRNENAVDFTR